MKILLLNWKLKDYKNASAKAYLVLASTLNTDKKKCYIEELKFLDMLLSTLGLNTDPSGKSMLNISNFNLS